MTQSLTIAAIFTVLYLSSGWLINHWAQQRYRNAVYSGDNLSFSTRRWRATLTDEGICFAADAVVAVYRWAFIREAFRGSRYVYFIVTPLQRMHIPVRAFSYEEHIQKFVTTAQSYVNNRAA